MHASTPPSPREAARAFTPELSELIDTVLYGQVWSDARLSARDRSIATLGAVIALNQPDELRAQLRHAVDNGVTRDEIAALITHVAFYGGFPAGIAASVIAHDTIDA